MGEAGDAGIWVWFSRQGGCIFLMRPHSTCPSVEIPTEKRLFQVLPRLAPVEKAPLCCQDM